MLFQQTDLKFTTTRRSKAPLEWQVEISGVRIVGSSLTSHKKSMAKEEKGTDAGVWLLRFHDRI